MTDLVEFYASYSLREYNCTLDTRLLYTVSRAEHKQAVALVGLSVAVSGGTDSGLRNRVENKLREFTRGS